MVSFCQYTNLFETSHLKWPHVGQEDNSVKEEELTADRLKISCDNQIGTNPIFF